MPGVEPPQQRAGSEQHQHGHQSQRNECVPRSPGSQALRPVGAGLPRLFRRVGGDLAVRVGRLLRTLRNVNVSNVFHDAPPMTIEQFGNGPGDERFLRTASRSNYARPAPLHMSATPRRHRRRHQTSTSLRGHDEKGKRQFSISASIVSRSASIASRAVVGTGVWGTEHRERAASVWKHVARSRVECCSNILRCA